ncbi:glycosyltransferase [Carnobacterium iners]|uniref:glycosyltransferase n=1 Tax=Carnobacterium iners TaxID=1073423 RepID=UPI001F375917|nr:glycosyltransferase [Carnobacterium iners]
MQLQEFLISAGVFGVVKNLRILIEELYSHSNFNIIVVCGQNQEFYDLLNIKFKAISLISILGYVKDRAYLMRKANLMITKAGGISLSEALAMQVPFVLTPAVLGQ